MSEVKRPEAEQTDLARMLRDIGYDLWGNVRGNAPGAAGEAGTKTGKSAAETGKRSGTEKKKPETADLLKATDITVDWTEALGSERPSDGLTGQRLWSFYHRMAEGVLAGDVKAYVEVLTSVNPLGDLTDYVSGMVIRTPDADRLECDFECRQELLEKDGRAYLGAMGIRASRDLFAVLPVTEVHVTGKENGQKKLDVTYRREQLMNRNFAFTDPARFTEEHGGFPSDQ